MNKLKGFISIVFVFLLFITFFNGFGFRSLYLLCGFLLLLISILLSIIIHYTKENRKLFSIIMVWIMYHVIIFAFQPTLISAYISLQHIGIIMFFWLMYNMFEKNLNVELFVKLFRVLHYSILLLLLYVVTYSKSNMFLFEPYIYLGLSTLFYATVKMKKFRAIKVFFLSLCWAYISLTIGARSQILSFIIFAGCFYLFKKIKNKTKIFNHLFIIYYICLNIFPLVYSWLSNSIYRIKLDRIALLLTSSRFFSGRDVLWINLYSSFSTPFQKLFGLGLNTTGES